MSDSTIPDAALDAAYNAYDDARAAGPKGVGDMLADVITAALPHLLTDEMVEAAAGALWDHREREERRFHSYVDPGDLRDLRAEARVALEAALVRDV